MVAFWLTPEYVIVPVIISHIETVMDHPEIFQIPQEHIREVYRKHQEVVRTEGQARQEIIRSLVGQGFIRIRRYMHPEYWSVNLLAINPLAMEMLQEFFWLVCRGKLGWREKDRQVPVILDSFEERRQIILQDLLGNYSPDASLSRPGLRVLGDDKPVADQVATV